MGMNPSAVPGSAEEVNEETVTVITVPVRGMVGQDKKIKEIFSREIQQ